MKITLLNASFEYKPINNNYCKEEKMKETKKIYYWTCPECKEEQDVKSDYFVRDCSSSEKCSKCGKRVTVRLSGSPIPKKEGVVTAYLKD